MNKAWCSLGLVLALVVGVVESQVTTEAICGSDWSWTSNSLNQSPCLVSSYLSSVCHDGTWDVPAVVSGGAYNPPSADSANNCRCNTVVYSLLQACSACQESKIGTWSNWVKNCPSNLVTVGQYPRSVPSQTTIPDWAKLSPTTDGVWNATEAYKASGATGQTVIEPEIVRASGKNNLAPIIGGAVGGAVALLIAMISLICFLRRRHRKVHKVTPVDTTPRSSIPTEKGLVPSRLDMGTPPPERQGFPQPASYQAYDPGDPATWSSSTEQVYSGAEYYPPVTAPRRQSNPLPPPAGLYVPPDQLPPANYSSVQSSPYSNEPRQPQPQPQPQFPAPISYNHPAQFSSQPYPPNRRGYPEPTYVPMQARSHPQHPEPQPRYNAGPIGYRGVPEF